MVNATEFKATDAQVDLSLRQAHLSEGTFSHVTAHIIPGYAEGYLKACANRKEPDQMTHPYFA